MDEHEIVSVDEIEIQPAQDGLHPLVQAVVQAVTQQDCGVDALERLMALQERHEAREAKRAFDAARVRLLSDLPPLVAPDREVSIPRGARYRYASLPQIMSTVMPALKRHGFAVSWRTDETERDIEVTCVLSYCGHDETCSRRAPPDNRGNKSQVQAGQSTVTYLQRHTLLALIGVVTGDAPDADEPPQQAPDTVDPLATLRAITGIRKRNISIDDAEEHLGRVSDQWTLADIERLRGWVRDRSSDG